ncbi:MAG: hypothetical protein Ta2A_09880 [Treponemataceae bacterium]|nr:MAG: hypothetical protein Ta2A_09880 [Treponemataceae bacterium]
MTAMMTTTFEEVISSPDYFKNALTGEGEDAVKLQSLLTQYLSADDPKLRDVLAEKITVSYWFVLNSVARKAVEKLPAEKKYLLRYALVSPNLLTAEQKKLLCGIPDTDVVDTTDTDAIDTLGADALDVFDTIDTNAAIDTIGADTDVAQTAKGASEHPIYYLDEWFRAIGAKKIKISSTDEIHKGATEALGFIETETRSVREMARFLLEHNGTAYPILSREYFFPVNNTFAWRETVAQTLEWIESVDAGVFCRMHKGQPSRILPYTLLLPSYGTRGICWEAMDKQDRVSSRGRIVVPMYAKNPQYAVCYAAGDLRWRTAKEKASLYWMTEGLTGAYYKYWEMQRVKGDVREFFIRDYMLWLTKESEGNQAITNAAREVFWRTVPFSKERKEKLAARNNVYKDLFEKRG